MIFSYYACLMSIVWFTLFILLGNYMSKKTGLLVQYRIGSLLLLLGLSIFRLVVPIELPFTHEIELPHFLPAIRDALHKEIFSLSAWSLTLGNALLLVWSVGIFCRLLRLVQRSLRNHRIIETLSVSPHAEAEAYFATLVANTKRKRRYRLIISADVSSPMIVGVLRPTILLPVTQECDKNLKYYIAHEWQHFLNHDQWIKLLIELICCFMWWNPVKRLLTKNLGQALEIRCDLLVTRALPERERYEYLLAMLQAADHQAQAAKKELSYATGFADVMTNEEALQQRVEMVSRSANSPKHPAAAFLVAMCIMFLLSFTFVLQPYYEAPDFEGEPIIITSENAYVLERKDGTFALFLNEEYFAALSKEEFEAPPISELPIILEE